MHLSIARFLQNIISVLLSPLVQGGLEIECQFVIETRATMLKARLTTRYLDLVKDLYTEPTKGRVAGNLFNLVMTLAPTVATPQVPDKRKTQSTSTTVSRIGIPEKCSQHPRRRKHQMLL